MLPKLLTSRLETILGSDYPSVIDAFSRERRWSFRINTLKWDGREVLEEFEKKGVIVTPFWSQFRHREGWRDPETSKEKNSMTGLPVCRRGRLRASQWQEFTQPRIFLFDRSGEYAIKGTDAFYKWKIYLQSIASMLPVLALDPQKGETILDVCAAPGSKTTQIAMMMENTGSIIALEQNQIRYDKLMYNAKLQWATIIHWEKTDARKWLEETLPLLGGVGGGTPPSLPYKGRNEIFDRILLDAPCSAEGRISLANEKTYGFWSIANIRDKSELQYEMVSLAYKRLKQWGTLVYSTCTLAPEENEWVISRLLEEFGDAMLEPINIWLSDKSWWRSGLTSFEENNYGEAMKHTVRILPSDETEGFFMGKIVRKYQIDFL